MAAILLAALNGSANGRQLMEVAERGSNFFALLTVACEKSGDQNVCAISGARIFRSSTKPIGAGGDPASYCYVETALNENQVYESAGNILIDKEGPSGSMCMTQLISTIDFEHRTYSTRKFSDVHDGAICSQQKDESHVFTAAAAVAPMPNLRCDGLEAIPSLWAP